MNDNLRRRYEMLLRVKDFGAQYSNLFQPNTGGHEFFMELEVIIGDVEQRAADQQSHERSAREGTTNRGEARTDLRADMDAISDTARAMAMDTPGLEDKFRIPRGKINDVDLLSTARAFAADALPLKDEFIRHSLLGNFLDKLNEHIEAFEQAIDRQQRSRRERIAATAALEEAIERGVNKVRQLDAVVRNKFRNDAARLAEWESARHTERAPAAAPPPEPTPPSTT